MTKSTVTRLFIGAVIALLVGITLAAITASLAIANDVLIMDGNRVVSIREAAVDLPLVVLGVVTAVALASAAVLGLASWIGALVNTSRLDSKAWFIALLLLGIFNFGLIAMIAYLIAGPDGTKAGPPQRAPLPA
jgi:hypothetical protein